ncbi:hypothetical protein [Actinacidiphila bryophytorum]|uniref:Uncharacterized protein n=1 Tax=Actinacidiphila bryophytorum TaxID=1436133 RepID=A0A9W4H4W2_9ACTN|nr:hypothetical protein [Actinacidiphila bryophytorum]MBM9437333.1 hypothetical protein [Actinacidiphila bryophytorum]MBN6543349.1 hypothetical protein [Actinacidiphila bryophytorum]CAG7651668.1 conserved exported hypothetical protein [Actinacidiphila bryophytorum]
MYTAATRRRGIYTAATALLAFTALQGVQGGAAAADDGTTPTTGPGAPATWAPQGQALAGAATTADAPLMQPGVTYHDTIKVGETRMYGITLDAKSSAYASAFALPPPGGRVAYNDGIELKLESADGDDCDSVDAHFGDDGAVRPVGSAVSRLIGVDTSCQDANQYTLSVHRTSDGASDPAAWPLELRYVLEPPLKSGAAAGHAPDGLGTASPTPLTAGTPQQAAGGTSFETAAAVKTGIWKDRVLPGETRFYKVPVDWGQQATVFSDFSSAQTTQSSPYVGSGVRLAAYSPVRELIDDQDHSYEGTPTSLYEQLAPVSYANRAADDSDVARVRYAGWYYFAVTVHPDVAQAVSGPVPVTLRVDVTGAAQSAPAYAGDPKAAGIGIDAHDVSAANGTPQSAGSSSGTSARRFLGFAALGAGTVLVLALAVWVLTARRRAVAAPDTVTQQLPPQSGFGPPPSW